MQRYLVTLHEQLNKSNISAYPVQVVGYKLTCAENGRAPELAGSIWMRMAKCDDPIHSGGEERRSGPGADAKQAEGKFESRWTRIEKFDDSLHSGGWEH